MTSNCKCKDGYKQLNRVHAKEDKSKQKSIFTQN